jgi:hypothetical protein
MFMPLAAVTVSLVGIVAFAVPAALASQADLYRGGSDNGTRANVTGSATNNSAGLVFASVDVQNDTPAGSPTAGLQVGDLKETSGYTSDCGTGSVGLASERQVSGNYTCDMTFASFGADHRLAVVKVAAGWQSYEDGVVIDGPFSLGFTAGYSVARAEAYWASTGPTYGFTWGPSGETAWQYTTDGGSTYTTISTATSGQDGGWSIGSPPSPFSITR